MSGRTDLQPKRETVRLAAARVFLEKGFTDTTIQDIADSLGISKGTAYYHVESKEQLLYDILDTGLTNMITRLEEIMEYPLNAADRLRLAFRDSLRTGTTDVYAPVAVQLQRDVRFLTAEHRASYFEQRDRYQSLSLRLIEEGIANGEFRPIENPKIVVYAIMGMMSHFQRWYRPDGALSALEVADLFWDFALRGITATASTIETGTISQPSARAIVSSQRERGTR